MLGEAKDTLEVPGRYIFPGGIDVHVHMDDLGAEEMEDWRHGSLAAAAGGIEQADGRRAGSPGGN